MGSTQFRNPRALSSTLAALGTLHPTALGFLNRVDPLVSVSNLYRVHPVQPGLTYTSNPEPWLTILISQNLSLADFKLNAIEQSTLGTLQTDLFHSICAYNSCYTFPALPSLINCMRKQSADKDVSNMTCTEVVSLLHSYWCSQSNTPSIFPPPPLFDHSQYEIQRGKAWEIWSCAMTSGRQMVHTRGRRRYIPVTSI